MATNWPPTPGTYPAWPPAELGVSRLEFSDIQTGIRFLQAAGFTRENPTSAENNLYFKQVRCDHGDVASGIMIVSPLGVRYPFAYCVGNHKAALVLWDVSGGTVPGGSYDLGWGSGEITV